jgi:hypothetical protein
MRPYVPPPDPQQVAAAQRRTILALLWLLALPPLVFALMVFGYSDQAPAFLHELTISLDGMFGSPVLSFLNPAGAR